MNENMNDYSKYNGSNNNQNNYNPNINENINNNYANNQEYNNNQEYESDNSYQNQNINYENNNSKDIFKTIIFVVVVLLIVFLAVYFLVIKRNNSSSVLNLDIQNKQIEIFESFKINASLENKELNKIKWTSSNDNCSVTNGEVYAKNEGECIIEASYKKQKRKVRVTIQTPDITNSVYAEKIGFDKHECLFDNMEDAKNKTCSSDEVYYIIRQYPKDTKYVMNYSGAFNYGKGLKEIKTTYEFNNYIDNLQKDFKESDLYFQDFQETFFCTPSGTTYKCPEGINVHCFATYDSKTNKQNRKCVFFNIKD